MQRNWASEVPPTRKTSRAAQLRTKAAWQLFPPEGGSCLEGRKNLLWFTNYLHCALSHHGPTGLGFQHWGFGVQSLSTPPWGNLTPLAPDTAWTVPVAGPMNCPRITVVSIGYHLFGWVVYSSHVPACNGQWIAEYGFLDPGS